MGAAGRNRAEDRGPQSFGTGSTPHLLTHVGCTRRLVSRNGAVYTWQNNVYLAGTPLKWLKASAVTHHLDAAFLPTEYRCHSLLSLLAGTH